MTRRVCFALDLVDDEQLIREYERRHDPGAVWPEIVRDIRDRGFQEMEIWRVADRLLMVAEVSEDYPRDGDPAVQPRVEQWEAEMSRYQKRISSSGPKWVPMRCIFKLSEQRG